MCEYAKSHYGVPADIGRRVTVNGQPGVIAADRGHYIGVNFDSDRPGQISNCHPTWKVHYLGMGHIRKVTRSQRRYQRYLEIGECFQSFKDFLLYDNSTMRTMTPNSAIDGVSPYNTETKGTI
jgi:hypothetical protein